MDFILYAVPFFFVLIAVELLADRWRGLSNYRLADAINSICWLMAMCHRCGHTLRFEATACPRCGAAAEAPWDAGKKPLPRGKAGSRP